MGKGERVHRVDADEPLVERMAEGDSEALAELMARHRRSLTARLERMLRSRAEAEEIVQETFLKAWQRAADFDPRRSTPAGWLSIIAKSKAIDHIRSERARRARELDAPNRPRGFGEAIGCTRLESEERRRLLNDALDRLPHPQRECLELAYYLELSHAQIAEHLDQPLGTVKSRLRLGLMRLAPALTPVGLGGTTAVA